MNLHPMQGITVVACIYVPNTTIPIEVTGVESCGSNTVCDMYLMRMNGPYPVEESDCGRLSQYINEF